MKSRLPVPSFFHNPTIKQLARNIEWNHSIRPEPLVLQLRPGHTGLPLYFIGAAPTELRIANLIGEDRAVFAVDLPVPLDRCHLITAPDRAAPPTVEQLGALLAMHCMRMPGRRRARLRDTPLGAG